MKQKQKILVYLFGSLGDSIVAIPALRAVRRHFAGAEIVLLQNFLTANLVKASQVIPGDLIDRSLSYYSGLGGIGKAVNFYRLWLEVRRERFDAAVYLVISERPKKAVVRDRLFFKSCGIRQLFGFHPFSDGELYPVDACGQPTKTEHEAVRKLRRLEKDGIQFLPDEDLLMPMMTFAPAEIKKTVEWLASRRKDADAALIALAPGCKTSANAWPVESFIELGSRLMAAKNCEIIVVGGEAEREMGDRMVERWGRGINSAGDFSVRESGSLLSRCDIYIGLDTGTTHLAAVAGTRCFAIYGERNNPGHWFPLGNGHAVLFHPVKCAGCRLQDCPIPDHPCMTGITIDAVWHNLQKFLKRNPADSETRIISV